MSIEQNILQIFEEMGPYAGDQLNPIVSQICDAIICEHTVPAVRCASIHALKSLVTSTNLMHNIGVILRSISFALFKCNDNDVFNEAVSLMIEMCKYYGKRFLFAASQILRQMKKHLSEIEKIWFFCNRVDVSILIDENRELKSQLRRYDSIVYS